MQAVVLNEGESIHWSQSLAWGNKRLFIPFRDEPKGRRELLVAGMGHWVLAEARWGGWGHCSSGGWVWGLKGPRFGLEGV